MEVKHIDFETIKDYWIEVNHFNNEPNKVIKEVARRLGPHKIGYDDPKRICYGLYDSDNLIGVTQLVQWQPGLVRYRTINVRELYRGKDLGWALLETAWNLDWKGSGKLFGWIRGSHYKWALDHGFVDYDTDWVDDHIAMVKEML